jgi:hypothetical protein
MPPFRPKLVVAGFLVLAYGFVAIGGQALHALAPCGDCIVADPNECLLNSSAHDHHCGCDQNDGDCPPHDNSTPGNGKPSHDASHCAICQWCAQGQLITASTEVLVSGVLVEQQVGRPVSVTLAAIELQPEVRGPPLAI